MKKRQPLNDTPPQVIARGFKDEPSVLYAVELQPSQKYVNVCRDLPARPVIGWPIDHAYDYDIDDFSLVWEAYSTENKVELETSLQ